MKTISILGHSLNYVDEGEGTPILFLHNGGGSSYIWRSQILFFQTRGYRVIAPDLIGCGKSSKPNIDMTREFQFETMKAFIEKLKIKKAHLVGNCIGANLCLEIAQNDIVKCDKLVLTNICPGIHFFKTPIQKKIIRLKNQSPILKKIISLFMELIYLSQVIRLFPMKLLFSSKDYRSILNQEQIKYFESNFKDKSKVHSRISLSQNVTSYTVENFFKKNKLNISPLIIWGEENRVVPVSYGRECISYFNNCEFVSIPKAGHLLMVDHAEVFNKTLLEFFEN